MFYRLVVCVYWIYWHVLFITGMLMLRWPSWIFCRLPLCLGKILPLVYQIGLWCSLAQRLLMGSISSSLSFLLILFYFLKFIFAWACAWCGRWKIFPTRKSARMAWICKGWSLHFWYIVVIILYMQQFSFLTSLNFVLFNPWKSFFFLLTWTKPKQWGTNYKCF